MKRRNVLAALGTLSAGGAFTVGSGAFTSVSAERSVTVDVVGDANAFLRLAPCGGSPNGDYVANATDGAMAIDLADGDSDVGGSGVNSEAVSVFHNILEIRNQGTQPVCVDFEVEVTDIPEDADVPERYDFGPGDPSIAFYRGSDQTAYVAPDRLDTDRAGAIQLDVGEGECIGLEVRAFGFDATTDLTDNTDMTIRAEAGTNCIQGRTDPEPAPGLPDRLFHWRMNEGGGDDVLDSGDRGRAKDGQRKPDSDGPEWIEGDWVGGSALEADGSGYVETPVWDDVDDFDLNDDYAIAYTVASDDDSENATILGARKGNDPSDPGIAVVYSNGWMGLEQGAGIVLNDEGNDDAIYTEDTVAEDGKTRIVINKSGNDPDDWTIYANGDEKETTVKDASAADIPDMPTKPRLFDWGDGTRRLDAVLDDVVIYDETLDADEVTDDLARQPW